jgi:flagellar hook-associated protein 1 FlgK
LADILSVGKSGLFASKKSLETAGHNLANANTEGYSRQRVVQTTATPVAHNGLIEGTGARVVRIERVQDPYHEKRLNKTKSQNQFHESRADELGKIENIFNEINDDGLNKLLNNFYNSFRELANQPENETMRSIVRDSANLVVRNFNQIRRTLDEIATGIDVKVKSHVTDVNQIIDHISSLNYEITKIETAQGETGDLRDQRDLALGNLSEFFEVHTYLDRKKQFTVQIKGVGTVLSGTIKQPIIAGHVSLEDSSNNMPASVEVFYKNRSNQRISDNFKSGKMEGIYGVKNNELKKMQEHVDSLAFDFSKSINALHRKGFVNRKVELDGNKNPAQFDKVGKTTNINFFEEPVERQNAAANLKLSKEVTANLSNITTGLLPNKAGDNRLALAISKLQHEKILDDGRTTFEEKYLQHISSIGLETGKANLDRDQSEGILAQMKQIRERVSGVSIDEETANMVKYQHAYEASAKVIKTADEMFDTILNLKR